jgi:hypothetical protein
MVEQGQTSGSSETTSCRVLVVQPLDQMDLGADPEDGPGRSFDGPDDEVGRTHPVGQLDHLVGALGVDDDDPVGCSARKASTCSGLNRWWTEQWPFHSKRVADLRVRVVQAAPSSRRGFHTAMSVSV